MALLPVTTLPCECCSYEWYEVRLHASQKKARDFYDDYVGGLRGHFGERRLSEIQPRDVEEYLVARRQAVKPATVNRSLTVLKHMLKKAIEWGYLVENPAARFKPAKELRSREFFLTAEQAERLLRELAPAYRIVVVAALHSGARRGELLALTWDDVDVERRLMTFRDTKNRDDRTIKMSLTLVLALRSLPSRFEGGPIFRGTDGKTLCPSALQSAFKRAVRRAGLWQWTLDDNRAQRKAWFRFHDLRHTCASWQVQAGVPLNTVRHVLGHRSMRMTLRYAHLAPDHLQDAADALDKLSRPHSTKDRPVSERPS